MSRFDKYLKKKDSPMPPDHIQILASEEQLPVSAVLKRNEINRLFEDGYLPGESGVHRFEDGSAYTAILTKMPNVTIEMMDWWFWWHAKEGVRYQIWYPSMHYDISADFQGYYDDETMTYREKLHKSTHVVTENVGFGTDDIVIDFMHPSEFGYDANQLSDDTTIICARVGVKSRGVWSADMSHFIRKADKGIELRSRFWIGQKVERMGGFAKGFLNSVLNKPFVKRNLIPKNVAKANFLHSSQEYHNLADILPEVYKEENQG